jgi:hypothetical protein
VILVLLTTGTTALFAARPLGQAECTPGRRTTEEKEPPKPPPDEDESKPPVKEPPTEEPPVKEPPPKNRLNGCLCNNGWVCEDHPDQPWGHRGL